MRRLLPGILFLIGSIHGSQAQILQKVKAAVKKVAKETTVRPMTILERFSLNDIATEDRTRNSPPTTNNTNPRNIYRTLMNFFCEDNRFPMETLFKQKIGMRPKSKFRKNNNFTNA